MLNLRINNNIAMRILTMDFDAGQFNISDYTASGFSLISNKILPHINLSIAA